MPTLILHGPPLLIYTVAYIIHAYYRRHSLKIYVIEDISLSTSQTHWCGNTIRNLNGSTYHEFFQSVFNELMKLNRHSTIIGLEEVKMLNQELVRLQQNLCRFNYDRPFNNSKLLVRMAPNIGSCRALVYHPASFVAYLKDMLVRTNSVVFSSIKYPNFLSSAIRDIALQNARDQLILFNFHNKSLLPVNDVYYQMNSNFFDLSWFGIESTIISKLPNSVIWLPAIKSPFPSPPVSPGPSSSPSSTPSFNRTSLFSGGHGINMHYTLDSSLADIDLLDSFNMAGRVLHVLDQLVLNRELILMNGKL